MAEAGFPEFDLRPWLAMLAPAGVPKEVSARLNAALVEALSAPDTRERYASFTLVAEGSSPAAVQGIINENIARWKKVVAQAKITPE
jgi:tripartite-type tricarboxylate transporter receptor subunit TctC